MAGFASALPLYVTFGITLQWGTGMPRALINYRQTALFTVDRAVGRNAPNDRPDVLLVQFLLFVATTGFGPTFWPTPVELSGVRGLRVATPVPQPAIGPAIGAPTHPKPQGNIVIDGICGNQTIGFIEYFQEQMQALRVGVELDGRVAPQGTAGTTTMILLNIGPPWTLGQNAAFPNELKSSLYF